MTTKLMLLQQVEMASSLKRSGEFYVIVAGITLVLVLFLVWLFRMDKRISKMEKKP